MEDREIKYHPITMPGQPVWLRPLSTIDAVHVSDEDSVSVRRYASFVSVDKYPGGVELYAGEVGCWCHIEGDIILPLVRLQLPSV